MSGAQRRHRQTSCWCWPYLELKFWGPCMRPKTPSLWRSKTPSTAATQSFCKDDTNIHPTRTCTQSFFLHFSLRHVHPAGVYRRAAGNPIKRPPYSFSHTLTRAPAHEFVHFPCGSASCLPPSLLRNACRGDVGWVKNAGARSCDGNSETASI